MNSICELHRIRFLRTETEKTAGRRGSRINSVTETGYSERLTVRTRDLEKERKMENCIFCKIVAGEIPSMRVYEDDDCIATLDIGPANPGHTLIIPKEHYQDLTEMNEALAGKLLMVAKEIGMRQKERLGAAGFNIVQNNGRAAGQTVPHFHIHVIPRYEGDSDMVTWRPTEPTTEALREILERMV